MKHISDIIKNGLNDLGKITKSADSKTALLKHLQKNVEPFGSSIKTAYIDKNNVLFIGAMNAETLSRIRFEEIQIRKLCKNLEISPKKIKFVVEP
tara:strand:- start:2041 stop:2325 length:285 start_codon:yes stop_codon:yes gene_type:complete